MSNKKEGLNCLGNFWIPERGFLRIESLVPGIPYTTLFQGEGLNEEQGLKILKAIRYTESLNYWHGQRSVKDIIKKLKSAHLRGNHYDKRRC